MKIEKFILPLMFGAIVLASCSPRVDDIFDDTAMIRLEKRRTDLKNQFMDAPNGWLMQYFAQSDPTSSDTVKHRGYNFMMQFRTDGTVTVGAKVDGVYNTETSMWDIINDNSSVLTFNTFNKIFHYYSNPDPALGLWGADGEGVGGDYEFMILEYNDKENYRLLKGKKRSCYIRMYPLAASEDWEGYLNKLDTMDQFIFGEHVQLDLYSGSKHLTLFNGDTHEFRAFPYGADTLGGGAYYGLIVTENGLRVHDDEILEVPVNRAEFRLNADKKRLVSVLNPNIYITLDGLTALMSQTDNGKVFSADTATASAAIKQGMATLEYWLKTGVGSAKGNKNAKVLGFDLTAGLNAYQIGLQVNYSSNGTNKLSNTFYLTKTINNGICTWTYEGAMSDKNTLKNYNGEDFVRLFDGAYTMDLVKGFTTSEGITIQKTDDSSFSFMVR